MKWLPTTPFPKYIGCTKSEKEFKAFLKKNNIPDDTEWVGPLAFASTHYFNHGPIICVNTGKTNVAELAGMLAHEAVHAWEFVKQSIGESQVTDELDAYMVQFITSNVLRLLYPNLRKVKV